MRYRILGQLELREGDKTVSLPQGRLRVLLAVLLLRANESVSSDKLIDALWGEAPPPTAGRSLHNLISSLRKALGTGALATQGHSYQLRVDNGELDAWRFESLAGQGCAALAAGDAAGATALLAEGLALWRGPPLADVELPAFARAELDRLDESRCHAQEQQIAAELALGHHAEVIGELDALIAECPLREQPREQLMLALYRCGRQADALEVYQSVRRTLIEQLGLEPTSGLRDLEQSILRQDPALELEVSPASGGPPALGASRPRRPRRPTVTLLVLGVVAVGAAVFAATGGGGAAQTVAPNSVGVIDVHTTRLTGQVPVGTDPGDISADGRSLWVANAGDATVSRINVRTQRLSATIAPGTAVDGMAAGDGAVWTSDSRRGLLTRIDPALRRVDRLVRIGGSGGYFTWKAPVATGDGSVWVANQAGAVVRIDPARRRVQSRIGVGTGGNALAVGDGGVWVARDLDQTVTRIDPSTNNVVATIPVASGPGGIAAGAGGVWVAETQKNALARIDPGTNSITATIPVGRAPNGVAVGGGAVWVANSGSGTVSRVDPATGRVTATTHVGQSPQALAIAHGVLGVTVRASQPARPSAAAGAGGGTARLLLPGGSQPTDPAIAPPSPIGYATGALLLNYPDQPFPAGAHLRPEVARAMPTVSDGGRTYTYRLREGFRFSPPSNEPVTAASFKRAIERTLDPRTRSYARLVVDDIVGLRAYQAGRARSIAGVTARDQTLTIRLTRPSPTLPTRLATPYFSAVPPNTPTDPSGIDGIATAGPYYIVSADHRLGLVLERNPNYAGDRPHRLREIDVSSGPSQQEALADVEGGRADALALTADDGGAATRARLEARYGPHSAAARAGRQRYFSVPMLEVQYLALNTERPLFAKVRLRRAVNYALDRRALSAVMAPSTFGQPTDQYIPPGMRGFRDAEVYPFTPDLAAARRLAGPGHRHAVLYTCQLPLCEHTSAIERQNLRAIGLDIDIRQLSDDALFSRLRRPGEPWDMADLGWIPDYADPADMLDTMFRAVGRARIPEKSFNDGRFADPAFQRRLQAVDRLTGARRDAADARLDADLARYAAPVAAYANATNIYFFSARMGCQTMQPVYGIDLAALCLRP
jgi:YVTN family beta-propeller protein